MVTKHLQTLNLKFDQVMFNSLFFTWERNFEVTFGIFSICKMVVKFYNCTNSKRMSTDTKRTANDINRISVHAALNTEDYRAFCVVQTIHVSKLTLFDMGGGIMPPKMFLTTVPKRLGGGS